MTFYQSIAKLYDDIFPYKGQQKNFVESFGLSKPGRSLLDVGCGTGSLALNLTSSYDTVVGIDPDKEMLERANFKALRYKMDHQKELDDLGKWVFMQKGMGDLKEEFAEQAFDTILCLGNTLVHLGDIGEVELFIQDAFSRLKPGGKLMIQIINYDRVMRKKLAGLPTIENEGVKFERYYHYEAGDSYVEFHTILTEKESGQQRESRIPLLALRPGQLKSFLSDCGYSNLEEYGSFAKESFGENSQPYIVVASK